jgi:single-stranded DNA-binding protein
MIHVLLTGTLYDTPVGRVARNGNPFATAKLLADVGDGSAVWCSMIAFAEAGERLAMLHAGDAVSVAGKARLSQWEDAEGKPRAGLDVTVTEVISLQSASKAGFRKPRTVRPDRAEAEPASETSVPFDDDLDFLNAGPAEVGAEALPVSSEQGPFPAATTGTVGGEATEKPKNGLQRGGATRAAVLKTPAKAPRKARKRRKLLQAPSPSPQD